MSEKEKKKKELTHIQVYVDDKEKLEKLRDEVGYASIAVTLNKIIDKKVK